MILLLILFLLFWSPIVVADISIDDVIDFASLFYPQVKVIKKAMPWSSRLAEFFKAEMDNMEKKEKVSVSSMAEDEYTAAPAKAFAELVGAEEATLWKPTLSTTTMSTPTSSISTPSIYAPSTSTLPTSVQPTIAPTPVTTSLQITITISSFTFARFCQSVLLTLVLGSLISLLIGQVLRPHTAVRADDLDIEARIGDDRRPDSKELIEKTV